MNTGRWRTLAGAAMLTAGVTASALAQEGMPDTRQMTCAQVQSLMTQQGAALLATGANTFNRYVRDVAYCNPGDVTKPQWVPTQNGQCYVGGICWDPLTDSGR